jgi:hypothetical protein
VTVTLAFAVTVVVLMLKVAVVALAATVTEAGTFNCALLSARVTEAPPAGAAEVSVTVHVLEAFAPKLAGLQTSELTPGRAPAVTTPPVAVTAVALPDGRDATALTSPIAVVVALGATVIFKTATVPFEMMVLFTPYATQVREPAAAAQLSDFPAAVAAGPGLAEIASTFPAGYIKVHSTAAGSFPAAEISAKFSDADPSDAATPELNARVSV